MFGSQPSRNQSTVHACILGQSDLYLTKVFSIRYHVDRCTMNKRMIQILTCGLFLKSTESSCLLSTHNIKNKSGCIQLQKRKYPLLGNAVPCSWQQIPILSGPLLEVNCLVPFTLFSPPHPLPVFRTSLYIQTTLPSLLFLLGTFPT